MEIRATTNGRSVQSNKRCLDRSRIVQGVARFPTPPPPISNETVPLLPLSPQLSPCLRLPHAFRSLRSPPRRCMDEWLITVQGGVATDLEDLEDWIGGIH
ncbi:hypothetical protein BT69DRAFT_1283619, partial [Atractiella rhizophila]